jgi:hypothetical protein
VVIDAVAAVGDFQVADFDVGAALQIEDIDAIGADELGARLADDACPRGGGRPGGDGLHGAAAADLVAAAADQQGVAAGDSAGAGRGQGDVGVLPGAGLGGAAARIGGVGAAGALAGIATVGTHVIGRGGLGGKADRGQQQRHEDFGQWAVEAGQG